jgi:hypothetical protein
MEGVWETYGVCSAAGGLMKRHAPVLMSHLARRAHAHRATSTVEAARRAGVVTRKWWCLGYGVQVHVGVVPAGEEPRAAEL